MLVDGATLAPFGANETHRIYAIPTGTDTILVFTWNLGARSSRRD